MIAFSEHPFSPASFPIREETDARTTNIQPKTSRERFYELINYGTNGTFISGSQLILQTSCDTIKQQFCKYFTENFDLQALISLITSINNESEKHHPAASELNSDFELKDIVLMTTPVIATELVWLQTISQVATGQTEIAAQLIRIYLAINQKSVLENTSIGGYYHSLLSVTSFSIPEVYSSSFAHLAEMPDCSFELANVQLALSECPRSMFPEILGFTLAFLCNPPLLTLFLDDDSSRTSKSIETLLFQRHSLLVSQQKPVQDVIDQYLGLFDQHKQIKSELWQRIQCGFFLYCVHFQRCRDVIEEQLRQTTTLDEKVTALFHSKAAAAVGHHGTLKLANKPLEKWFSEQPFAGEQFLKALRESPYVDNEHPAASSLLKLFDFGGPMFGVLSSSELNTLVDWIHEDLPAISKQKETKLDVSTFQASKKYQEQQSSKLVGFKNRKLYYFLVNSEFFPEAVLAAEQKTKTILAFSRWFSKSPIKIYQRATLDAFAKDLYQREIKAYQPLSGQPKLSKQAYLWGIEQFAPTILTDGCWLQNINQLTWSANKKLYEHLDNIYFDELGCGVQQQNHPFIYHELLESQGIKVPAVHTQAFTEYPNFIDSAFDLPVYLMSIAMLPHQYLPELLGLNLAIELSGLGKVYMRLADELAFWGIDPTIVKLHISIDNMASGHSALALESIHCYLDDIAANLGEQQRQVHWHRIATGYNSLKLASRRFQIMLIFRYWQKKLSFN